jgi:hypothetical protein
VAKKVRRKLEQEDEPAFEFPTFDEKAFADKEFELTFALSLAGIFCVLLGVLSWALSVIGLWWFEVFPLGLVLIGVSPSVIARLRAKSSVYTRGARALVPSAEPLAAPTVGHRPSSHGSRRASSSPRASRSAAQSSDSPRVFTE